MIQLFQLQLTETGLRLEFVGFLVKYLLEYLSVDLIIFDEQFFFLEYGYVLFLEFLLLFFHFAVFFSQFLQYFNKILLRNLFILCLLLLLLLSLAIVSILLL